MSSSSDSEDDKKRKKRKKEKKKEKKKDKHKKRKKDKKKKEKKKRKRSHSDTEEPKSKHTKHEPTPQDLIKRLLSLYPDGTSDITFLFNAIDSGEPVDIEELEDQKVKNILQELFEKLQLQKTDDGYKKTNPEISFMKLFESVQKEEEEETTIGPSIVGPKLPSPKPSLVEQHQTERARKIIKKDRKKEKLESHYLTFDRERDLNTRYIGPERLKAMVKDAQALNSRFQGGGKQTSFL